MESQFKNMDILSPVLEQAESMSGMVNALYSPAVFREANTALQMMKDSGVDINILLSRLGQSSDAAFLNKTIKRLNDELAATYASLYETQRENSDLRSQLQQIKNDKGVSELERQIKKLTDRLHELTEQVSQEPKHDCNTPIHLS